ncbi:hypothetical protein JCGZ_02913 [Jatropha curcas]|uniref:Uncharacterized protein n=1 Tax=Jatropha curcas TaxID=180498 RepID=A0A067L4P6_JATCU|nr:hypothetical protein JCGZ_02913 [Jatropha curcas]
MASLMLLLSVLLRPKNLAKPAAALPSSSFASSFAAAGAGSVSSNAQKPLMNYTKRFDADIVDEDVPEPKFNIDLSWP